MRLKVAHPTYRDAIQNRRNLYWPLEEGKWDKYIHSTIGQHLKSTACVKQLDLITATETLISLITKLFLSHTISLESKIQYLFYA